MLPVDIDFSADDGWSETRHVYLAGNNLPAAWKGRNEFTVSELGFGTGLNLLALAELAQQCSCAGLPVPRLHFQSVEWLPRDATSLQALARRWPALEGPTNELLKVYQPQPGWNLWEWSWGSIRLYCGDARDFLEAKDGFSMADAWFLDGYAPDRNPELWGRELLAWVGRQTKTGGTAATYSAAGVVKQGLRDAGFVVVRAPGWGAKRHMVRARKVGLP